MAWLEMELSLGVRRMLAVMLAVWTCMMAFAGFGLLVVGLILHGYVTTLVVPPSKSSSAVTSATTSSSKSVMWYSYSVVTLGILMTITYALGSQVSVDHKPTGRSLITVTNCNESWRTPIHR